MKNLLLCMKNKCRVVVLVTMLAVSVSGVAKADRQNVAKNYQLLKAEFASLKAKENAIKTNRSVLERSVQASAPEPTVRVVAGSGRFHVAKKNEVIQPSKQWKSLLKAAKKNGVKIHHKLDRQQFLALELTETQLDALMASDELDMLAKDEISYVNLDQSIQFIGADLLQMAGFSGQGTAVAILDTGVDNSHEFFSGRIVEEACFSSGDGINSFSLCPNGETRQYGVGAADDCSDIYTSADCRHGTHVAGIAAGNGTAFSGVAPLSDIVAVQVFTYFPSSTRLGAYLSDQVAALDWLLNEAQTPNIVAANMSLGGGQHTSACDTYPQAPLISALREAGIVTAIASGNDAYNGAVGAPGCISAAVTVGSTVKYDNFISSFSNSSDLVDLLAPGSSIQSSVPGNSYMWMSGTSMATPHVAGAFAALKSVVPEASVDEIEHALKVTGVPIQDLAANVTMPRIDMIEAFDYLYQATPTPTPTPGPNSCKTIPGLVSEYAGTLDTGESLSWGLFAQSDGLYRMYLESWAGGSQGLNVRVDDYSVDISVVQGITIVDFPAVPAGTSTLTVTANSDGAEIGGIEFEHLLSDGVAAAEACTPPVYPVPGLIAEEVGFIPQGDTFQWDLELLAQSNLRFSLISNAALNSREIELTFNGMNMLISMDPGFVTYIDFADVPAGDYDLQISATNEGVVLGQLEVLAY